MIRLLIPLTAAACLQAQDDALLTRIWEGVQDAQNRFATGCGKVTEKRTSKLLARPLVFRGNFCAEGFQRFRLDYTEPSPVRIVFNEDYLNVTVGRNTEVLRIGDHVRRTQKYFSRENSLRNLKESFTITARETGAVYEMKLVPRSERFAGRIRYVIVKLAKDGFLLRNLEVDGTSGVNSVFDIEINSLNAKPGADTFRVYRPQSR